MAVTINDPLVGSDTFQGRVTGPIVAPDLKRIAADQAGVREALTNVSATGSGGSGSGFYHRHRTPGLQLFWPWMSQMFGDESWQNHEVDAFNPFDYAEAPSFIYSGADVAAATNLSAEIWQYFPLFIPAGWEGKLFIVAVSCFGDTPGIEATLETWSGTTPTAVADMSLVRFRQGGFSGGGDQQIDEHPDRARIWYAQMASVSSGLHTVKVTCAVRSDMTTRYFTDIAIFPVVETRSTRQSTALQRPDTTGMTNVVQVGDPDGPNTWHPIDDVFVNDNMPLGAAQMLIAHNDALLQEWAMDLPAGGNATKTVDGHDHSETGDKGAGIEFNVGSWTFGPWPQPASHSAPPPQPKTSTFETVCEFRIMMPTHSLAQTPATPRLYGAVLCYNARGHINERFEAQIMVGHPTNGAQQETVTFTAAAVGGDQHQLLTHPAGNGFRWVSGGDTIVRVKIRNTQNSGSAECALLGFCLYFAQP